jgi:hypothetical protein
MRKLIDIALIAGFLMVDFLFFHDILKPGENITPAQYLTGLLSIPVLALSVYSFLHSSPARKRS